MLENATLDTRKVYMYYVKVGQGFNNRMLVNGILITTGVNI